MCGRYSITLPPEAIRQIFRTHGELPNWPAYYNAAPTTALPIIRQGTEGRALALMTWGLIPWFSKDGKPSYSTINARAEGVQTAASYREPFKKGRRCIVPASGYFEWTGPKNDRQPHYFTRADGQPMALAGLWDRWRSKDSPEVKETFTILTTGPSTFAAQFHNRMPLILEPDTWDLWLKGEPEIAATLMKPANENVLVSRPVNKAVGNVKNNGPELLESPAIGRTVAKVRLAGFPAAVPLGNFPGIDGRRFRNFDYPPAPQAERKSGSAREIN